MRKRVSRGTHLHNRKCARQMQICDLEWGRMDTTEDFGRPDPFGYSGEPDVN